MGVIMTNTEIFHILPIISQFSSVFSQSYHYSTWVCSLFFISFHNSTWVSSIFFISFHYSTYLSSIFSRSFRYSTYFSSVFSKSGKIWKKPKLKSEKLEKGKLKSEMIWKIWKISVLVIITP